MAVKAIVFFDDEGNLEKAMTSISITDTVENQKTVKKLFAFVLVGIAIAIVFHDAYDVENGWIHPEMIFYHIKFLANSSFEKVESSFNMHELRKVFWWEEVFDGGQNRLLTGLFALIDVKFRPWLFQYIPPNPAISLSWLLTLFLTPLLLYNFIRHHIKLTVIGSAALTVLFVFSPTTVGNTFELFHPGKVLVVFFHILLLNIFMAINNLDLSGSKSRIKQIIFFISAVVILFFSLFTDPYAYSILFLIPIFFPNMFIDIHRVKYLVSYHKDKAFKKLRIIGFGKILRDSISCLSLSRLKVYVIYGLVIFAFLISVYWALPRLSSEAGFKYEFMQVFKTQISSGAPCPYLFFLDWRYYSALLTNMCWFAIANLGLRSCLPLGFADLSNLYPPDWISAFTFTNTFLYLLIHVMFWMSYFLLRKYIPSCKKLLLPIISLYVAAGWITLVHGHHSFLVPYSTFIYGSPFTIIFVLFLAAVLNSFKKHEVIYSFLVIMILVSSFFSYQGAKDINKGLKEKWYDTSDKGIDTVYLESRELWKAIKENNKSFDPNMLKIDKEVHEDYLKSKSPHDQYYTKMWMTLSADREFLKSLNFAAFGGD